jgi:uncharacterized protein YcnI
MRCSGWSLRAISACSAAGAALLLAAPASASLSISPPSVQTGGHVDLVFSVPNAKDKLPVDRVTLGVPPDFTLDDAEAKTGWSQSRTGQAITWSGGQIPQGEFARFAIRGTAPGHAETAVFNVLVGDRRGKSITYQVGLVVLNHGPYDSGARSRAKTALIVAVVAAVLAVVALLTALYAWLRSPH